jgi:hypothetical protein
MNLLKFVEYKVLQPTMCISNSGLMAKMKVSKIIKGLCLTEKLVHKNPLLFLY